jgi:hypothetical protein
MTTLTEIPLYSSASGENSYQLSGFLDVLRIFIFCPPSRDRFMIFRKSENVRDPLLLRGSFSKSSRCLGQTPAKQFTSFICSEILTRTTSNGLIKIQEFVTTAPHCVRDKLHHDYITP